MAVDLFFFQAEDGIRDVAVTGVQTCALPIYYRNLVNNGAAQALYYRALADQSKIPVIIYNWPQVTGVDIPTRTVVELAEHPSIIAVKESSGNIEKTMQMIRECPAGFQVLVGSAPKAGGT